MKAGLYNSSSDEELISLLKERDYYAFSEIYARYWNRLYIQAYKVLKSSDESCDVVQDVFTNIWVKAKSLEIKNVDAYLFSAVRYKSIKVITSSNKKEVFVSELAKLGEGVTNDNAKEQLLFKEAHISLEYEISQLPPKMQHVYRKGKIEGLSYKQIAEEMGISENSVKTTMFRAMEQLRKKLTPYMGLLLFFLK